MRDIFDFTGKVVIVTGATRGLGRAIAFGFAERGAHLVICSRKAEACDDMVAELAKMGCRALAHPCHIGQWDQLEHLIDHVMAQFGRIDVLVNNAGIAPSTPSSLEMPEDLFDKIVGVNLKGPFRLSALAFPYLQETGGSIINITSTGAIRPAPAYPVYAAAKGALNIITKAQAMEFGPHVRVNAIMAGPFWTDISKAWREDYDQSAPSAVRRIGQPEEIVSTALYLASPMSSYTNGTIVQVDGGTI
jgi:NAD(P)-dependent dehydrogenase (short-subunit alcohol dehydrogenase family)